MSDGNSIESVLQRTEDIIGYRFRDRGLLVAALTHASGATTRLLSNERLEFLGDSVLGLIVCHHLFVRNPEDLEGELTKAKSNIVSRRVCARVARRLGLEQSLFIGRGMLGGNMPRSLLSDVFEAIIAAVYLDGGFESAQRFVLEAMKDEIESAILDLHGGNHKSQLQHFAQRELSLTPGYKLISQRGPDHEKIFLIAATLGNRQFTPASGTSKKDAEQRAACNAMAELQGLAAPYTETDPFYHQTESAD